ncbi:MAG: hypothetical protein U1E56_05025 [Bauldia sp.]
MTGGKTLFIAAAALLAAGTGVIGGQNLTNRLADAFIDRLAAALDARATCAGPWAAFDNNCIPTASEARSGAILVAAGPAAPAATP